MVKAFLFVFVFSLLPFTIRCTNTSSGSLDTTLGDSGKITTDFSGGNDEIKALAVDSTGRIIAAGKTNAGTNDNFALARYTATGQLDTSFGTNGLVTTDFSGLNDVAYAVKIQTDGKIIAGGVATTITGSVFALARYTTEGALDSTFGSAGIVTTRLGSSLDEIHALGLQSNGAIVAVGFSKGPVYYRVAVVRYDSNGNLDTSFNGNGKKTISVGPQDAKAYDLIVETSGLLTLAGTAVTSSGSRGFLALRLLSNGTADLTFNGTGTITQPLGNATNDTAYGIRKTGENKYVLTGTSSGDEDSMAATKLTNTGVLDTTFGTSGIFLGKVSGNSTTGNSMLLLVADKILIGGTEAATTFNFGFLRLNATGALDYSFGSRGAVSLDFNSNLDDLSAMTQQADGKIIVGGRAYNGSTYDFALARLIN